MFSPSRSIKNSLGKAKKFNTEFIWLGMILAIRNQLKVKRLGEGGTQTFDTDILPEIILEIKGRALN